MNLNSSNKLGSQNASSLNLKLRPMSPSRTPGLSKSASKLRIELNVSKRHKFLIMGPNVNQGLVHLSVLSYVSICFS